jgi:hypothetical protein
MSPVREGASAGFCGYGACNRMLGNACQDVGELLERENCREWESVTR